MLSLGENLFNTTDITNMGSMVEGTLCMYSVVGEMQSGLKSFETLEEPGS